MNRKLRYGMIGGGRDAFIGAVHRMAANLDGQLELVAGAFSADPAKSRASGADLLLDPDRVYGSYLEMAQAEAARPAGERLDFVVIVTPNHLHFPIAKAFLEQGFHVVCDKPVTFDLGEAKALRRIVRKTRRVFVLTHNYSGYPMVKEARERVLRGELGEIRKVVAEYPQGWLSTALEATGQKQAGWRTDPKRSGAAGCIGDIGTHAEHLARYVTGLQIDRLCADLTTFVPGRKLDDDGSILIRYRGGARGVILASQISIGEENGLSLRVYGTKAALEWHQEQPNELVVKFPDQPRQLLRRGNDYLSPAAKASARLPAGHPEAFLEGFANLYREAARAIGDAVSGNPGAGAPYDFPTIDDGVHGMAFIETVVASAKSRDKWLKFPKLPK